MNPQELQQILQSHAAWRRGDPVGKRADLSRANLSRADLRGANLRGANLRGADLCRADLCGADLCGADLSRADLCDADLSGADLRKANLSRTNLIGANLRGVNLRGADLRGSYLYMTNFRGADLRGADLEGADLHWAYLNGTDLNGADLRDAKLKGAKLPNFLIVPEIGQFYGFKKLQGDVIATLLIPKSAKRTNSLVGRKCRASKVKVVALSKGKKAVDRHTGQLEYEVGKWIVPDKYDDDIRVECTNGIHFFITRKEAEEYDT